MVSGEQGNEGKRIYFIQALFFITKKNLTPINVEKTFFLVDYFFPGGLALQIQCNAAAVRQANRWRMNNFVENRKFLGLLFSY
jgi:hypothetical protein